MSWGILGVNINLPTTELVVDACWSGTSPGSLWNLRPCSQISVSSSGFAVKGNVMPQTFIQGSKGRASNIKNPTRAKIPCRIVSKYFSFLPEVLGIVWMYLVCHSWLAQMGLCHFQSWNSRNWGVVINHYVRTAWVGCILGTGKTPPVHQLGKVGLPWSTSDGGTHWGWDTNFIHHFTIIIWIDVSISHQIQDGIRWTWCFWCWTSHSESLR